MDQFLTHAILKTGGEVFGTLALFTTITGSRYGSAGRWAGHLKKAGLFSMANFVSSYIFHFPAAAIILLF